MKYNFGAACNAGVPTRKPKPSRSDQRAGYWEGAKLAVKLPQFRAEFPNQLGIFTNLITELLIHAEQ